MSLSYRYPISVKLVKVISEEKDDPTKIQSNFIPEFPMKFGNQIKK
jgi:hypothetical protein